jgi:predicted RNase H-like HicB family nuclease
MKTSRALGKADVSLKTIDEYMKLDYEIVIRALSEDEGGGWFAYYKDFKGVMGDAETPEEAIKDVRNAFKAFVENALANGDSIPMPSSHQPKAVRLNITIPEDELEVIDKYAKSRGMSRSGLIQAATKQYIRAV